MKIVIDIPKEIYIHLLERYKYQNTDDIGLSELDKVGVSIKNGTPLPKGHGAIKDVSQIEIPMCEDRSYEKWVQVAINSAPTIIEGSESE